MSHVSFIEHKGKQILLNDLRGSRNVEENIAAFHEAQDTIVTQPPKSVLLLTDVSGAHYDSEAADHMKKFAVVVTPYVKASAGVGVSGIKRIIAQVMMKLSGRKIELFDDVEQAKDWLVEQ